MNTGNPYIRHNVKVPNASPIKAMARRYLCFTEYSRMVSRINQIKYIIFKESEI
jgi:hypothetical protein